MKRLLCLIGWHNWTWLASEHGFSNTPPDEAKCSRCGIRFNK